MAPEVLARDERGRATLRAVRLTEPLTLDGALDERVYRDVPPVTGFFQVLPNEGEVAEEQTEVWVTFDGVNFYISGRCHNSAPESEWVADDMRRDGQGIGQYFGIMLDTFYDRRNAVSFLVNPLGGRMDGEVTNERTWNGDWNPVWSARVGRYEGGWSFEMAIPFRSLRYRPGRAQTWGINLERFVVWKNEYSTVVPMQASWGLGASMQMSGAATLVGVEVPEPGVNLEVKPYAIAEGSGVRAGGAGLANDATGDAGLDVKYGITENLVADFTLNTDFAQVEADEQQINLTRFSLFFPEKREFFLENQGVFSFGAEAGAGQFAGISNQPILFYSRQIGLHSTADGLSREVPITAGGRVSGRIGRFSVGMLNMQTGDLTATAGGAPGSGVPATNFSVLRLRRDILRRSNVGVMYTGRSDSLYGTGANQAYGVDGLFSFYQNLNVNAYWAETRTPGAGFGIDEASYRGQLDYTGDRYGVRLERLSVGRDFNPEMGGATSTRACFLRRRDFDESLCSASARARGRSRPSGSSSSKGRSTTSRTARASSRPARAAAGSGWSSSAATCSTSSSTGTTSTSTNRFRSPGSSSSPRAPTTSTKWRWATRSDGRTASPGGSGCSTAASTAAPRRASTSGWARASSGPGSRSRRSSPSSRSSRSTGSTSRRWAPPSTPGSSARGPSTRSTR